jgi:hypothetical protein
MVVTFKFGSEEFIRRGKEQRVDWSYYLDKENPNRKKFKCII